MEEMKKEMGRFLTKSDDPLTRLLSKKTMYETTNYIRPVGMKLQGEKKQRCRLQWAFVGFMSGNDNRPTHFLAMSWPKNPKIRIDAGLLEEHVGLHLDRGEREEEKSSLIRQEEVLVNSEGDFTFL